MKVDGPYISTEGGPTYIDSYTYFKVGSQEWRLYTTLNVEEDAFYDADPEVALRPEESFEPAENDPPGVVLRAYEAMRPKVLEMLQPYRVFNPDRGFDSPNDAVCLILEQEFPLDALMAIVRCNVMKDEYGFAVETIRAYQVSELV